VLRTRTYHVPARLSLRLMELGPEHLKQSIAFCGRLQTGASKDHHRQPIDSRGHGTALYLSSGVTPTGVRITRLARGLPSGSVLECATARCLADRPGRPSRRFMSPLAALLGKLSASARGADHKMEMGMDCIIPEALQILAPA